VGHVGINQAFYPDFVGGSQNAALDKKRTKMFKMGTKRKKGRFPDGWRRGGGREGGREGGRGGG